MIKAIIFDFFGVLVGDGFDATYRQAGGDPDKDKVFIENLLDQANGGKISVEEFRRQICQKLNITVEDYEKAVKEAEVPNTELLDFIKTLKRNYKTAILSNVSKGGLERRIDRDTLNKHFDVTVSSAEVGYMKPQPEAYRLTAKLLKVAPEDCVFIDDRVGYVEGAREIGMKAIWYKNYGQMKAELMRYLAAGSNN